MSIDIVNSKGNVKILSPQLCQQVSILLERHKMIQFDELAVTLVIGSANTILLTIISFWMQMNFLDTACCLK